MDGRLEHWFPAYHELEGDRVVDPEDISTRTWEEFVSAMRSTEGLMKGMLAETEFAEDLYRNGGVRSVRDQIIAEKNQLALKRAFLDHNYEIAEIQYE
jgi:hypothetical protein